ncbi:hypothetical protein LIER_04428 [Lithospermum erythrorhizon]|uniref:Uncharacterized protein n=1 Tax=Lithospermum erythrorhizon TaxID=34254 RepID=A0AAV3NYB2_LITER
MAGGDILRHTPPSSTNRENSPVHIIDANTLSQSLVKRYLRGSSNQLIEALPEGASQSASEQVACKKAGIQATVPLFASLFTSIHRPYETSLSAKGGGRLNKNFLVGPRPNKVHKNRFEATVWKFVQKAADPNKVEVAAMKGKRLLRFNSQLVVRKPLAPGATPIPVFP